MITGSFPAMGTLVEVWSEDQARLEATREWFEEVEAECSRFRADSSLTKLNDSEEPVVEVDGVLRQVVCVAQIMRELTTGLVDIGVGGAVSAWGYDRSFAMGLGLAEEPGAVQAPAWHLEGGKLYRSPGTRIDLGGVAKGWACDRAVERGMAEVISAGGDIRSSHEDTTVPIIDPWGEVAAEIRLGVGALATSSVTRRRWKVGEGEATHLIDPRTLSPVESPILSATVVAATAAEAESGAKAVLILGEDGLAWGDSTEWVDAALAVWADGSVFATAGIGLVT